MNVGYAIMTALMTFISPCVLPLLPVYVTYFAGGDKIEENKKKAFFKTLFNALAFCAGITLFFLGIFTTAAFASSALGSFKMKHMDQILIVCGIIIILFGFKIMGWLNIPFLNKSVNINAKTDNLNIFSAFVLGLVFSFSMGLCAFAYGSWTLIEVMTSANFMEGFLIGLAFTLTLDVLFMVCTLLIDQLKGVFKFIQKHYKIINLIAGALLVVFGVLMALGITEKLTALLNDILPWAKSPENPANYLIKLPWSK